MMRSSLLLASLLLSLPGQPQEADHVIEQGVRSIYRDRRWGIALSLPAAAPGVEQALARIDDGPFRVLADEGGGLVMGLLELPDEGSASAFLAGQFESVEAVDTPGAGAGRRFAVRLADDRLVIAMVPVSGEGPVLFLYYEMLGLNARSMEARIAQVLAGLVRDAKATPEPLPELSALFTEEDPPARAEVAAPAKADEVADGAALAAMPPVPVPLSCESVAAQLAERAASVQRGDLDAFYDGMSPDLRERLAGVDEWALARRAELRSAISRIDDCRSSGPMGERRVVWTLTLKVAGPPVRHRLTVTVDIARGLDGLSLRLAATP